MSDRNSMDETGTSPMKELDIRAKRILCKKLAGVISDDDFIEEFEKGPHGFNQVDIRRKR